jgi:hypothetical protein
VKPPGLVRVDLHEVPPHAVEDKIVPLTELHLTMDGGLARRAEPHLVIIFVEVVLFALELFVLPRPQALPEGENNSHMALVADEELIGRNDVFLRPHLFNPQVSRD